ncbi:type III-B CRISPR-associated protein Cas10/Cmr2 [Thiospirillum jenense]|uniref:Type III-B CRISPR-associated protein Cas10/Cmr2 n=1 Tax=Thiospirillum jenense TaxID=1653858 RepID=A0A839H7N8_9GAMM|nr:type III-B CRISPR-associated protein Cas10/Cmr2 [Thiospirillum jenense]MBB1125593.1 type III-B CRISPR-associated protein Cas10/Cmr2 [Thiospirillum jenense]
MPRYLVTLSLGPVQSLIEAARRTRDLWCGSWLLSESARAAARVLHQAQPGCLIFPCPANPDVELQPQKTPRDDANIANIIRAEVELADAAAARDLCERAKTAAAERLRELGEQALGELRVKLRHDVWQAQIGDILESFAAWVEIADSATGEQTAYQRASVNLSATLAARKTTRDFQPSALELAGLPKSSLDGAMETVLPDAERWSDKHRDRLKLGLSGSEQLDALGVMKRLAGDVEQFTAYARVAADPWIEQLQPDQQRALSAAYDPLVQFDLATRVRGNVDSKTGQSIYAALPYDAQLLYEFRLDNARAGRGDDALGADEIAALDQLRSVIRQLSKDAGAPVPYAVILKADGDRMGKLLQQAKTADNSRAISRELHGFASSVREIVRKHRGHAIYAGGDDVLALLPLPNAVPCARALADEFAKVMGKVATDLRVDAAESPTLSVGLGIGHFMEPLGRLRKRAGDAEHLAKGNGLPEQQQRNALAIILGVRSGGEVKWRANWNDATAFDDLQQFINAYRAGQLPSRVAYDLRAIDLRLDWLRDDQTPTAIGMRRAEVARMLDRARMKGGGDQLNDKERDLILNSTQRQPLAKLANTLIMARWLAARSANDLNVRGE